jgi:hypothetical protein
MSLKIAALFRSPCYQKRTGHADPARSDLTGVGTLAPVPRVYVWGLTILRSKRPQKARLPLQGPGKLSPPRPASAATQPADRSYAHTGPTASHPGEAPWL